MIAIVIVGHCYCSALLLYGIVIVRALLLQGIVIVGHCYCMSLLLYVIVSHCYCYCLSLLLLLSHYNIVSIVYNIAVCLILRCNGAIQMPAGPHMR